jgi:hypothetical protein
VNRILCLSAATAILATPLPADWKVVTRNGATTTTEYFKGSLHRTDYSPVYVSVLDHDHRSQVNWRVDLRQYAVVDWPSNQPQPSADAPVITVERNTADTGERKSFFRRPARHLVTRMTRSDNASKTVIDGWYVDAPGLPKWRIGDGGSFAVLTIDAVGRRPAIPRIELKQTGPTPEGLAVRLKTTSTIPTPGAAVAFHADEFISEVTELVDAPLSDKLFQPPDGYRRVAEVPAAYDRSAQRTWGEAFQAHWKAIGDWFSGLFGTASKR